MPKKEAYLEASSSEGGRRNRIVHPHNRIPEIEDEDPPSSKHFGEAGENEDENLFN